MALCLLIRIRRVQMQLQRSQRKMRLSLRNTRLVKLTISQRFPFISLLSRRRRLQSSLLTKSQILQQILLSLVVHSHLHVAHTQRMLGSTARQRVLPAVFFWKLFEAFLHVHTLKEILRALTQIARVFVSQPEIR